MRLLIFSGNLWGASYGEITPNDLPRRTKTEREIARQVEAAVPGDVIPDLDGRVIVCLPPAGEEKHGNG